MSERNGLEIAVIGMAGRFPGARDLEGFWRNLRDGVEAISFFTDEELAAAGVPARLLADPAYVKAAGILEDVELFDADFFEIPPREAELVDPQQRLLLECAYEALERAGYAGTSRSVGVFAGTNQNSYLFNNLAAHPELLAAVGGLAVALASERDFIATRLSYKLNLSGPSLTVQTACSTSLVAVHLACQSLLGGECDLAIAGGASVRAPQKGGHVYQKGGISSPDGHCRAFDARAEGTVIGQGLGVVVLKPLEDALADGDHIHAVIKGSAINNDGALKAGFTAPSRDGQAKVIRAAHRRAEVEPDSISYIEAHGTATPLGDPIEIAALTRAFRLSTQRRQFCAVGSVKTNIGHLDAAAGVAGLIKTVLALEHRQIPPSLHFETPNPEIDFASSPFAVNTRLSEWEARGGPRRAGVSAFGLGGTNAHVVLEEPPPAAPSGPSRPWQLLSLSARGGEALERATDRLAGHLAAHPEQSLADVAFTLHVGRKELAHRRVLIAADAADAADALASRDPRRVWTSELEAADRPVAFLLPGVGDHYPGMAQELYRQEEVFRREIDRCAEALRPELGLDLREAIRAGAAAPGGQGAGPDLRAMLGRGGGRPDAAVTPLAETRIAQPAVFAVSWALAQLWLSWGVRPRALLGYSLGEYTAACLAGVLTVEDALRLVARRARLIAELPPGAMLAVPLPEEAARLLSPELSLAAINGPAVSVLSGTVEAVAALESRLAAEGMPCRRIPATHAFHSAMMEPVRRPLADLAADVALAPPRIPYLSNVTGGWITAAEATDPGYWARHLCAPVRFGQAVEALWSEPGRVLLEVGPGHGLSTLALQHPANGGGVAVPSLPHAQDRQPDGQFLLGAAARLWLAGVAVDWAGFYQGQRRRRLPLPAYPFERKRFWIDPPRRQGAEPSLEILAEAEPREQSAPASLRNGRAKLRNPYVAPGNATEERLVALWQSLLGIEPIGIHDNFFELGGHSLLGTQMMARLRTSAGVELPLRALFENPTVADLAQEVAKVSAAVRPPLRPRPDSRREAPLSYAQQRLWFLDQLAPGSSLHNIPSAYRLRGPLDPMVLTRAFNEIVRRHGALRTTFMAVDGLPVQRVGPALALEVPYDDLSGLPEAERRSEVRRRLREAARQPFDLATGPLLRAVLLRLDAEEHALLLVFHHIVSDGWSIQLTLSELIASYTAFAAGEASLLPELAIQYTDYAVWQREWLDGGALAEQLAFWTEHLAGAPLALDLPTDRPHPPVQTFAGAAERIALPAELAAALSELALAERASLFMVLLAAFNVLLFRHGAQDDIVLGTPIANRTEQELERLIGLFVNTLALRTDLSGDPTFRGLLARVSRVTIAAYDRQDLPFERLVDALRTERTLSRTPIFQALFQLLNQPVQPGDAAGFAIESLDPEAGIAAFDLTFSLVESRGGILGLLEYNTDLFDAATVQGLLARFSTLLQSIAADPDRRLSELPLLSGDELRQVLHAWGDTAAEIPGAPVHRLFEAQVARTPAAVAAVFAGESLTYAGLNARANRLAHRLRALGAGPESLVGVALERSLDLLVAVLGVLKAGAAYVPLDPSYPAGRLAFMLRDSGVGVLLTHSGLAGTLPEHEALVLHLEAEPVPDPGNPEGDSWPESLAYVLYTSGSTGRPKGVQISYGALANFLWAMGREPGLRSTDVLLAVTSLSFDIAGLELYLPLLAGARLEIASGEAAGDGRRLLALLRSSGATVVQATPATWRMLLEAGWDEGDRLRLAMTGGEALRGDLAAPLRRRADELWNVYGPTETTVWSTVYRVEEETPSTVSIGGPIANTRLYVLDRRMVPMPAGAPGELYIGGAGVARGYLGRPDLTAERFVPDPWSADGGERLYRTGDLVRVPRHGALEFLGRVDHQVKVRGFRIETGEIEAALAAHPAVHEAAVVVRTDGGDPRLVAYVVRQDAAAVSDAELREFLGRSLPDYMVPSAFMVLDALPLTPNRKVDRKALPAPQAAVAGAYVAPRNSVEEALAGIWTEVLQVPRVGIEDDFFSLGGHSLLATRMISRVRTALGAELSVRGVFEAPTVRGLAARITLAGAGQAAVAPPLGRTAREAEPPLSFAQERLWFLAQLDPDSSAYHLPAVLRLSGPLDPRALEASLSEIARRHEPLRTVFAAVDGRPVQVIRPPAPMPLPLIDLAGLPASQAEPEVRRVVREEVRRAFDLARGPLARAALLRLGRQDHVVLWNTHHIVSDGWSIGLFVQELGVLYPEMAAGRPSPLPELPLSYADYAVWQRRWLQGEVLSAQLRAWKSVFAGVPEALDLPTDRPRPAVQTFRGGRRALLVRPGLTAVLREVGQGQGATLYMTLAAAFAALLGRSSRQEDIVLGSPTANRNRPEVEALIGFFVNTMALRVRLDGDPAFAELIGRARETVLTAFSFQDVPFEKLIEELQPERSLSHTPLFQVMFILQNAPLRPLELPGLTLSPVDFDTGSAMFDLTLSAAEAGDRLLLQLEYNRDLFDPATVQRYLHRLEVLLEGVAALPSARFSELPLLTAGESHQVRLAWNDAVVHLDGDLCVHELFALQARRSPDAVAVACGPRWLTYADLDRASLALANRLRAHGAGPETLVGLAVERSPDLVVAALAILRAGSAYVPLDPDYPRERLAVMLEDSGAPLLLTESRLLGKLPESAARVLLLDEEAEAAAASPLPAADPGALAYVIYTSGSTGRPKGVQIPHRALTNFLVSMSRTPGLDAADRLLAVTSLSFDIAGLEIYLPLIVGARIEMARREETGDGQRLAERIEASGVTALQATPATWRMLFDAGWQGAPIKALCGGEALPASLAARLGASVASAWNVYGPTETTIWSTLDRIAPGGEATIGRPIANTTIHLLDGALAPVPLGIPGELHIGGTGLARGYRGRPDLTAERFLPDPFGEAGERTYRTGDLCRHLPDGRIEFLGRIDHQVKVRGFRIELGEIETAIARHPGVREAVVLARTESGEARLVAYVVPRPVDAGAPEAAEIVDSWRTVWDETYKSSTRQGSRFDITGWASSYTGAEIPEAEMREWVDRTVENVLALRPRRVLEIGCGSGLLLFRISPHCERYHGIDLSERAVEGIARELEASAVPPSRVSVAVGSMDRLDVEPGSFDTVILNSVVQYFPNVEYLLANLEKAVAAVAPGGRLFLGDIRSLPLLEAFHASVELYQAADSMPVDHLRQRVARAVAREQELLLDPGFFTVLARRLPAIGRVDIQLKRGSYGNEVTRFRYDAVLHVGPTEEGSEIAPLDWQGEGLSLAALEPRLRRSAPDRLAVANIPNARLLAELETLRLLNVEGGPRTAGALRAALEPPRREGVDPEEVWALAARLGYEVRVGWSASTGAFDAVFRREGTAAPWPRIAGAGRETVPSGAWQRLASDPAQGRFSRRVIPQLRELLGRQLPEYMLPSVYMVLGELPKTPNGKIDRRALPAPEGLRPEVAGAHVPPGTALERTIAEIWREVLGLDRVGIRDNFFDLGGHSLLMVQIHARLREALKRDDLTVVELFRFPTIVALAEHLEGTARSRPAERPRPAAAPADTDLAVIGIAGRFPGARDLEQFWSNLRDGVESVRRLTAEELEAAGIDPEVLTNPAFVPAAPVLDGVDLFDAGFFNFSPREAEALDPQQRLLLECAWECVEQAGYDPTRYPKRIGVFAGARWPAYALNLFSNPEILANLDGLSLQTATDKDYLSTRISYLLSLRGPSLTVQTACSTSLVALHVARQSLLAGDCDMALVGGVAVQIPQTGGYLFTEGGILSPDGHCRAFDARGRGTLFGSGVGAVLLKPLDQALRDGDHIHAVLKGSAINNDGSQKVGYTAPSVEGQAEVIAAAQAAAGVSPDTIQYIEAHGTATPLGDPIEIAALTEAFRGGSGRTGYCAVGSVKTNVGHLDAAAGIAGFLKTVLALEHQQIPPSLHYEEPNPKIDFAASPFRVNTALTDWRTDGSPRRAGVSSFGIGGTNAHVILEEAPPAEPSGPARPWQLLVLSARGEETLEKATDRLAAWLDGHRDTCLADVAFTLQTGRRTFEHRRAVVCRSPEEAAAILSARDPERLLYRRQGATRRPVVFLFPGQGTQHVGMGRELYETEPVFRRELDACAELLRPRLGRDLRDLLYPADGERERAEAELLRTRFAQPALFAVEYALARLWMSWNVEPWAMIGHSLGEYVAACLADVFSLADALALVAARGEMMERLPGGAMLAVDLPEDRVVPLLGEDLSLAAVNGPFQCVVSGPEEAVARLERRLAAGPEAVNHRRLHTSHAFHSAMMEPILGPFTALVGDVLLHPPTRPFISNLTGTWITAAEATDPAYWARHLRSHVRFADGIASLLAEADGGAALLELGPGGALGNLARQQLRAEDRALAINTMRRASDPASDASVLLRALGRLWLAGVEIDWTAVHAGARRLRLALPTYPFARKRYWLERKPLPLAGRPAVASPEAEETAAQGHERPDLAIGYHPPSTETERRLAAIWQKLLGIERIGVHDDFFELGGHSLLATQILSRVREELRAEVSLEAFFQAGTVAGLARAVETAADAPGRHAAPPLRPAPRDDGPVPLSFAQQRLWFFDQLDPGGSAYNMAIPLRLQGRLDRPALRRALDAIVSRHESLRTRFATVEDEPFQVIGPATGQPLPEIDLMALPASVRDGELRRLAAAEATLPFDLARGPVLRTTLVRVAGDEHALLTTVHHIVFDGWSMGLLTREVAELYGAFAAGLPSPLPEPVLQYADFAIWQRQWLQGEALEEQLAFWRQTLAAAPAVLELPTDRPRPLVQTFRGAVCSGEISAAASAAVRKFGAARGATPFMVLQAVFNTLLGRLSGQTDVVAGTPVANRNRTETEGLIGFFANTLALRTDLSGDPSFEALLDRVRRATFAAFAHQDLPFERLVEELRPQRQAGRQPLFQVMFAVQNVPVSAIEAPGLTLRPIEFDRPPEHFDLSLFIYELDGGAFAPVLRYSTDLFEDATAARLLERFCLMVETAVTGDPARPLSLLPWLSEAERHQVLIAWNDTGAAPPPRGMVHEIFALQVRRTPNATAVIGGEARLTYRELDERAERAARGLRALGVGPETLVGICLPRTPEIVVHILAVLKAGGAWLALDPAYPAERLAFMLRHAQAPLLLTHSGLLPGLSGEATRTVCLDVEPLPEGAEAPLPAGSPEQAAYLIYTSGSTGRPKGVALTHANLSVYVGALGERLGLREDDVYLHTASFSFSSSVRQLMMPLCHGAAVVLAGPHEIGSPRLLFALAKRHGVTVMDLVPSYWRGSLLALRELDAAEREGLLDNDLRLIVSASERLLSDVPEGWSRGLGHGARLVNMLGQTETTGIVAVHPITGQDTERLRTVPVGRPLAGTALYLVDRWMEPVPAGAPGEVCIGGTGVGRGYLGQPDLTAERFVPDPWSGVPGARLYRTGDMARHLQGGDLDFIGRLDHQVKVRGFRIEPGEIEAALCRHPGVHEAAVVARDAEHAPGEKSLAAYFVPAGEAAPGAAELRAFLREILPDYMVPSAFLPLAVMPLTPTGKLDRGALPAPTAAARPQASSPRVPPRTRKEQGLAEIWQEILRLDEVGVEDDFFELGGHSLLATQVISRIRKRLGVELPLRALFERPTIAALAASLPDQAPGEAHRPRTIQRVARRGKVEQLSDSEVESLLQDVLQKRTAS